MVVVPGPDNFWMGVQVGGVDKNISSEPYHHREFKKPFAIAAKLVTVEDGAIERRSYGLIVA